MKTLSLSFALFSLAACASDPDPRILEAARAYPAYGKVDDTSRWAPTDCAAPPPAPARLSASRDEATHGRKLYYLFAKDRGAYLHSRELPQPPGQVVVKESWYPGIHATLQPLVPGDPGPLFLMLKTGGAESDGGWIYATVSADRKTVTASGRIASCMECHEQAKNDRLFGLRSCASPD